MAKVSAAKRKEATVKQGKAVKLAKDQAGAKAAGSTGSGADAPKAPVLPAIPPEAAAILGSVQWLMMHSPAHKHLFITDYEWLVLPPLMLRQFRLVRKEGAPVAFVTWAYVTEETEKRLLSGATKLRPQDWKAGDSPWIIDVVAPFGGRDAIIEEVRKEVFLERAVRIQSVN